MLPSVLYLHPTSVKNNDSKRAVGQGYRNHPIHSKISLGRRMDSVRVKVGMERDRRAKFFLGVAESIGLIQTCLVAKAFATNVGEVASLNPV